MAAYTPPPLVNEIVKRWDEAKSHHGAFVRAYERRERAYRGTLQVASDAAKWRHKLHPPYAFNLIETIVANTVEMGLRFDVRPSPQINLTLEEAQQMLSQVEAVEDLLRHEHRVDEMDYKQRPLFLTAAIGGRGVGKTYWNYREGSVKRQVAGLREVRDTEDNLIGHVPTIKEEELQQVICDHSTFEVVDPRDFVLHESARALQPWEPGGAQYLFHRCWYSFEQLKAMERADYVQNVDMLKESLDFTEEYRDRESQLWEQNRRKDLIEVLEYWCFRDGRICRSLVGNRVVLLSDEEANPFWHGQYPFVICSSMSQPFSTIGMSEVELVEELQNIIWELTNQSLDNVELINNAVWLINTNVEDPDAFEHYPGARWPVDGDPAQAVQPMVPPYQVANIALEWEALLKGDLQNVTSAAPFAGGAQSASVDQKTATGVSLIMSAAQARLAAKKWEAQRALKQEAWMRIKNCQQFIERSRLVHVLGDDGAMAFKDISVLDIQGEFICELEPIGESQNRQEKRAEWMQLGTYLKEAAPLAAAAGAPLNMREVIGQVLKRGWDQEDADRFFSQQPASAGAMAAPGGPGGGGGPAASPAPPPGAAPNLGITAGSAVDASSPSATGGASMSPVMALQRALAMNGGINS